MKENVDKDIEELVDKVMQSSTLETPSIDFTSNIMAEVNNLSSSSITVYEPLISKHTWFILLSVIFGFTIYLVFNTQIESKGWFDALDFSVVSEFSITNLFSGITFSKTFIYAVLIFAIMFFIQIPILKNYLDKRLEV